MLGRLVRLMRFAGYDVEYDNSADDHVLRKAARYRVLLTKDRELAASVPDRRVYFVRTIGGENQLQEIRQQFPESDVRPRCLKCNRRIRKITKTKIEHLIPPFVYKKYKQFYSCPECKRIYWQGTHFERMSRIMR